LSKNQTEVVVVRCSILYSKFNKKSFVAGLPTRWGAYSAPADPLAVLRQITEREWRKEKEEKEGRKGISLEQKFWLYGPDNAPY